MESEKQRASRGDQVKPNRIALAHAARVVDEIASRSKLTEKDALEIGKKIKKGIARRHGLKTISIVGGIANHDTEFLIDGKPLPEYTKKLELIFEADQPNMAILTIIPKSEVIKAKVLVKENKILLGAMMPLGKIEKPWWKFW